MIKKRLIAGKKGVSPVIATVLLIAIVVVIGLIIFLWFRSLTEEAVTKFGGQNIQLVCDDVEFLVDYSASGVLSISNTGNVPIHDINLEIVEDRSRRTEALSELSSGWPEIGLRQGDSFSGAVSLSGEVLAIPILVGTSDSGETAHTCEDRHGREIII